MKLEDFLIVPAIDIDGNISDKKYLPFNIVSSSVSGGYNDISSSFTASFSITNNHADSYADLIQAPMQGPYTEKYVGGEFYRHQDIATEATDVSNRKEGYFVEYDQKAIIVRTPATTGDMGEGNLVPEAGQLDPEIRAMTPFRREEFAKRPVSIKNIQHTTGSTIVGNYDKSYDFFNSTGRKENNLWFRDFTGSVNSSQDIIPFEQVFNAPLDRDFELPRKQRNENIITSRFSAPGERETFGRGYLDQINQEYSSYSSINFRNRIFKDHLQKNISGEQSGSLISGSTVKLLPPYLTDGIAQLAADYNWYYLSVRNTPTSTTAIDLSGNDLEIDLQGSYTWTGQPPFDGFGFDQLGLDFDGAGAYALGESLPAINSSNEKMLIVSHTRDDVYSSTSRFSELRDTAGDRLLLYSTAGDNLAVFDGTTTTTTAWLPRENEDVLLGASMGYAAIPGSPIEIWANGYLLKYTTVTLTAGDVDFAAPLDYSFGASEAGTDRTGGQYGFAGVLDEALSDRNKAELFKKIMGVDSIYYWDYLVDNGIASDLVLHWPLFESESTTTDIADVSQAEKHGTVTGNIAGADAIATGLRKAVALDASTSIAVAASGINAATTTFTIEFWVEFDPDSLGTEGALWTLGVAGNSIELFKEADNSLTVFADDGATQPFVTTAEKVTSGVPYRIYFSYNPTTDDAILNVNGVVTGTEFTELALVDTTNQQMSLNTGFTYPNCDAIYSGFSLFNSDVKSTLGGFDL